MQSYVEQIRVCALKPWYDLEPGCSHRGTKGSQWTIFSATSRSITISFFSNIFMLVNVSFESISKTFTAKCFSCEIFLLLFLVNPSIFSCSRSMLPQNYVEYLPLMVVHDPPGLSFFHKALDFVRKSRWNEEIFSDRVPLVIIYVMLNVISGGTSFASYKNQRVSATITLKEFEVSFLDDV